MTYYTIMCFYTNNGMKSQQSIVIGVDTATPLSMLDALNYYSRYTVIINRHQRRKRNNVRCFNNIVRAMEFVRDFKFYHAVFVHSMNYNRTDTVINSERFLLENNGIYHFNNVKYVCK